jgi:hypothetical protein
MSSPTPAHTHPAAQSGMVVTCEMPRDRWRRLYAAWTALSHAFATHWLPHHYAHWYYSRETKLKVVTEKQYIELTHYVLRVDDTARLYQLYGRVHSSWFLEPPTTRNPNPDHPPTGCRARKLGPGTEGETG